MQSTCSFFVNLGFIMVKNDVVPSIINQNPICITLKDVEMILFKCKFDQQHLKEHQ